MHFKFGLKGINYIWNVALPYIAVVDEFHKKRYRDLLA
jgi:hypothetical protein